MRKIDSTALYDKDLNHWIRQTDNIFIIGLSDFGQEFIGAISTISDLPNVGDLVEKGALFGVLESDKAASEIHLPIGGKVLAVNEQLLLAPHLINTDCYGAGWIVQLTAVNPNEIETLQSADRYAAAVGSFFNK